MTAPDPLDEYRSNIDLWKHIDMLRQGRNQTFLTANSAALVASGLLISASEKLLVQGVTAVAASIFGVALCTAWRIVQARHDAYVRFHREKLVALEQSVGFSTYAEMDDAFHRAATVIIQPGNRPFRLQGREQRSASVAEARLPSILLYLWLAACTAGLVALTVAAL
jgi:hypothetical protein